ncbi:hypothetical protein F5X97DRAFT_76468 [Nemania serpens]|nr:hypothetical protein F5X97DRAFT_76468 [Nemania serpens]
MWSGTTSIALYPYPYFLSYSISFLSLLSLSLSPPSLLSLICPVLISIAVLIVHPLPSRHRCLIHWARYNIRSCFSSRSCFPYLIFGSQKGEPGFGFWI